MIDTHCHINFDSYDEDRAAVLQRAVDAGVTRIIIPAVDIETSREIVKMVTTHGGLYGAVGIHPNSTADFTETMLAEIETLAAQPKIISIGEIGLDYYWDKSPKEKQFQAFEAQLALASQLELPVIIHNRQANEDTISILETWAKGLTGSLKDRPGVMHSFSGTAAIAERALACGFYLGFTGPITYKNADETRRIAAAVPLDRLLVETDGPFLTPVPHRGKRNEPAHIPLIVERLAGVTQSTPEEMARIATENAVRLFQLN
ncbi:MAG: TatD family hydrolase [Anaerolineae bacterium]|nr:TatD family hydrolase [Anaerolineae bacterium]